MCPIKKLTCVTSWLDVIRFTDKDRLYFESGDDLDYFEFFLKPGSHEVLRPIIDPEEPNCDWKVDGQSKPWPMTAADCTLALDNVEADGLTELAAAITNFHKPGYDVADILGCALGMLSGRGDKEGGVCDLIGPAECQSPNEHSFGSFYSDLPPPSAERVTIDPRCEEYGYRRRRLLTSSPERLANHPSNCTSLEYDMYLIVEGAHFAGLATPKDDGDHDCPPVLLHSATSKETNEVQKAFSLPSYWDINGMDPESKIHVGSRPLDVILGAFESVDVGLNLSLIHISEPTRPY